MWLGVLLVALLLLAAPQRVIPEPCVENPKEAVVQFTHEECKCCYDLEDFIHQHEYVFVMFYMHDERLSAEMWKNFEDTAAEWKWSRVSFARIDTSKDKEMAQKWIDPSMVPTFMMFRRGKPVDMDSNDLFTVRDDYRGSPDGFKWMMVKNMGADSEGSNLHYAKPIVAAKKYNKFVKKNEIALAGFFKKDNEFAHKVFLKATWRLHQDADSEVIGAAFASVISKTITKNENAKVPSIVVYVDGKIVEEDGVFSPEKWTEKGAVEFMRQFLPLIGDDTGGDTDDDTGGGAIDLHSEL